VEETRPVVTKGAQGATLAASHNVQAHDVLRAYLTFQNLAAAYWDQYGEEVAEIKAMGRAVVDELAGPGRVGKPPQEGVRKGKVRDSLMGETYDYDAFKAKPLTEIREIARALAAEGIISETTKKPLIMEEMEEKGLFRPEDDEAADSGDAGDDDGDAEEVEEDEEFEDDDADGDDEDDDEDDDAEDDAEDGGGVTADELREMNLKALQETAEENNIPWRKKSQDVLLAELLAAVGAAPDEDEEDGEDEDDDEDPDLLTEERVLSMSIGELRKIKEQLVAAGEDEPPLKIRKNQELYANWVLDHLEETAAE
jgi:hypothetical protein